MHCRYPSNSGFLLTSRATNLQFSHQRHSTITRSTITRSNSEHARTSRMLQQERSFNTPDTHARAEQYKNHLTPEQRVIYDQVMQAVRSPHSRTQQAAFVYSPGGCGKTFLFEALLASTRAEGRIALAVASSGLASLLLTGGTTAHYRFKLSLDSTRLRTCNISTRSAAAHLLREAALIIWDEAPMAHRFHFQAVDMLLRELMGQPDLPFGGKVVVMGGDFRQVRRAC